MGLPLVDFYAGTSKSSPLSRHKNRRLLALILNRHVAGHWNFVVQIRSEAHTPGPNRALIYWGACLIAGIRLAREKQVNVRVIPTSHAIDESIEVAHEIFNRVFRSVPEKG